SADASSASSAKSSTPRLQQCGWRRRHVVNKGTAMPRFRIRADIGGSRFSVVPLPLRIGIFTIDESPNKDYLVWDLGWDDEDESPSPTVPRQPDPAFPRSEYYLDFLYEGKNKGDALVASRS